MEKKVSLIIAAYNVEKYIEKCIKSIMNQTYKNIEIIVVNDGSIDNTLKICEELRDIDSRILIINRENGGLSAARNSGLDVASGEYIAFVDGDDYIVDSFCQVLIKASMDNDADIINFSYFRDYGDRITSFNSDGSGFLLDRKSALEELVRNSTIKSMACMKFYKSKIFKDLRFKEGVGYEDVYLMHQVFMKANRFFVYNVPLYYYFYREDSISNIQSESNLFHRYNSLLLRFNDIQKVYPEMLKLLTLKTSYSFVDIYNSICAGKYMDQKEVLPSIKDFFQKNSSRISVKIKLMFLIVRFFRILNLNRMLHKLMVKLINS